MMNMCRRFSQLLKSRVCAVLFTICLISFLPVSASAASVEADASFSGLVAYRLTGSVNGDPLSFDVASNSSLTVPRQNLLSEIVCSWSNSEIGGVNYFGLGCADFEVFAPQGEYFSGDVGLYLNYFIEFEPLESDFPAGGWEYYLNNLPVTVRNAAGEIIEEAVLTPRFYDVDKADGFSRSKGVSVGITFEVPESTPAVTVSIGNPSESQIGYVLANGGLNFYTQVHFYIPSATLIAERTNEELKELENITNIIINQNNITSQYYGDVMSKVDSLYTEVGNLADLQERAIQQFDDWNTVSSVPGSVQDKVDKADQVIADINSLVKPDPEQIVPDYLPDPEELHDISDILSPFFQNALIVQLCTMVLGFAFVSYVLFGKKG